MCSGEGDERVITFRTNVGDVVEAGPEHPLRFVDEPETGGLKPYVLVRGRLEALVARPVMYELVEHGEEIEIDGVAMFAVRSHGAGLSDHAGGTAEAAERLTPMRAGDASIRPRISAGAPRARRTFWRIRKRTATTASIPAMCGSCRMADCAARPC